MNWTWITTSVMAAGMVLLSVIGMYLSLILLTRATGLRSFSKLSSFDFAITVAIGSVLASTIVTENPPLFQAVIALAALYSVQMIVAVLRQYFSLARHVVDNEPLLLMAGDRIIEQNLRTARITEADLWAKLREANVLTLDQVHAVVMETTGDISVLHGAPDGPELDIGLLQGVKGYGEMRYDENLVEEEM